MSENNEDVAKELKQLHDKADWLDYCIRIKLGIKRRKCEFIVSFGRTTGLTCFRVIKKKNQINGDLRCTPVECLAIAQGKRRIQSVRHGCTAGEDET